MSVTTLPTKRTTILHLLSRILALALGLVGYCLPAQIVEIRDAGMRVAVFRCPSDGWPALDQGAPCQRVRRSSMNQFFNWSREPGHGGLWRSAVHRVFSRLSQVRAPDKPLLLSGERVENINDSTFATIMEAGLLGDWPSSRHNGAGGFSFVDGHDEMHKWLDPRLKPPVDPSKRLPWPRVFPDSPDFAWLQDPPRKGNSHEGSCPLLDGTGFTPITDKNSY